MRRSRSTPLACSALLLVAGLIAGCGSSGKPSATTSTSASTAAHTAGGSASSSSGGLKATTTPRFATPEASAPIQSGVIQIAYRNIAIAPDTLRVKVGSTIRWTNYDSTEHNVTSVGPGPQKFASKDFGENGTFEIKVENPGVIHYESTTQPATMNGTIEVVR
jgi:plastocyanin